MTTERNRFDKNKLYDLACKAVILGAFIVVCMISFLSEFGKHPDEYDVRVCLDWCENRFIWPDMRLEGEGLGDTYSGYGYTKVCNYTAYFLIFSKISFIFRQFMHVLPYFRIPNLLLMAFMCIYCIRKLDKHRYLMLGFGICVQAWYIYSYVTADAWDFTLAFIGVALLADKQSFLWKTLESDDRCVFRCILLGLLYGMSMLGKPYYYANLLLVFIVLVYHLIKSEFNNKSKLLVKYFIIAGVTVAVFLGRFALDLHYYGFDKSEVKAQMEEKWCDYDKNPLTPVDEQVQSWRMMSKGYSLGDMFEMEPRWFLMTFRSFVSARITFEGEEIYFILMAILLAAIYVFLGVHLYRIRDLGIFICGTCISLAGVAASVIFSYTTEIQPQGRYLLPIVITTCYLGSRARGIFENRWFKALVLSAASLSIIYFGLFDSRKLIDLAYARSLF